MIYILRYSQTDGNNTYNLEINFVNKELFFTPFSGLITNNNNLYILGGYNEKLKSFHNFKIDFFKFCDERHKTDTFKINTVSLIKNKKIFHYAEFVPYTQSQLINISNNNAFLVGGYFLNYTIEKGC